jgi:hypothetical protein
MKALALCAAVLCCVATAAHAEAASQLRSRCTGMTGVANASGCRNFIGGQVSVLKDDPAYCIPKDLDNQTALTVVQAFLKSSPDVMHLTTAEAIGHAMAGAYPCPAKP